VLEASFAWDPTSKIVPAGRHLYLVEQAGGPQQVQVLDRSGKALGVVPLPEASAVSQALPSPAGTPSSCRAPPTWSHDMVPLRAGGERKHRTPREDGPLRRVPDQPQNATVSREWAASKDGTRVPLTVIAPRGVRRDGSSPALLTGYGGYGISQTPHFDPGLRIWLDHGGIAAVANLRGGDEFARPGTTRDGCSTAERVRRLIACASTW